MSKRVYEQITNYLYFNNDPDWKRPKLNSFEDNLYESIEYNNWKLKLDKYNKNDLYLLNKFKNAGFDFDAIYHSKYNINNIFNNCRYYNIHTDKIELKPILYILIVKLYDNTYKLKIGYTNILKDSKTKGLRLDRLISHSQNFDEIYYYMMIPIDGRHIEEKFHEYIKINHSDLIVQNAYNNKNKLVTEIYELDKKMIDILLSYI